MSAKRPPPSRRPFTAAALASLALHGGAALALAALLRANPLADAARERGVEIVWQDSQEDSAPGEGAEAPPQAAEAPSPEPPIEPEQDAAQAPPPQPQSLAEVAEQPPPEPPPAVAEAPEQPPLEPPPSTVEAPVPPPPEPPPAVAEALPPPPPEPRPPEPTVAEAPSPEAELPPPLVEPRPAQVAAARVQPPLRPAPVPAEAPPAPAPVDALPLPPPPAPAPPRAAPPREAPAQAMASRQAFPGPAAPQQPQAAGASRATGAVSPPGLLDGVRNPEPEYPLANRQGGDQGVVTVLLRVSETGQVTDVDVVATSGFPALDDSARRAVQRWRFRPATRDGVPVEGSIRTAIHFRIR